MASASEMANKSNLEVRPLAQEMDNKSNMEVRPLPRRSTTNQIEKFGICRGDQQTEIKWHLPRRSATNQVASASAINNKSSGLCLGDRHLIKWHTTNRARPLYLVSNIDNWTELTSNKSSLVSASEEINIKSSSDSALEINCGLTLDSPH